MPDDLFLGIDGGQSHTEALIAGAVGNILGHGHGGPSNHADEPGGRRRLGLALADSVGQALRAAGLPQMSEINFASAHCAMTGGAEFKEEVIHSLLRARHLVVGHDAPAALAGATGCQPGIIVIAGTGSVAYGENAEGQCARAGGWGYLFGDEGAGFGIALEAVRQAARAQDGLCSATPLLHLALEFFKVSDLDILARSVYSGRLRRDDLAAFAQAVHDQAWSGVAEARRIIEQAAESLAALASAVAQKLKFPSGETPIFRGGGMFRGAFFLQSFEVALQKYSPRFRIGAARFDPAVGALLLAYRAAGLCLDEAMLLKLDAQCGVRAKDSAKIDG